MLLDEKNLTLSTVIDNITELDPNKCYCFQINVATTAKDQVVQQLQQLKQILGEHGIKNAIFAVKHPMLGGLLITELDQAKTYSVEVEIGEMREREVEQLIESVSAKLAEHNLKNCIIIATRYGVPIYRFVEKAEG